MNGLTCGGDSGSPLVIFNSREMHYVQVGIVSGGSCQSFTDPAIFARIEDRQTLEFITKQFWDHIPPTGVKAIERLMVENKVFARDITDLKEKMKRLSTELGEKVDEFTNKFSELNTKIEKLESKVSFE